MSELDSTRFKQCYKCKCTKPATLEFFSNNRRLLSSYCRICNSLNAIQYNRKNKARRKEMLRKANQKWRKNNKAKIDELQVAWRERNREKARQYTRVYLAQKRQAPGEYSLEEVQQMYLDQDGLCAYCEKPLLETYHVEHMIPLSRGGRDDWTNLAIACPSCNIRKRQRTAEEFMN